MLGLVIVMSAFEAAGVVSILPFLWAITDPESIESNRYLSGIYGYFRFTERLDFIVALGISSAAIIAFSSAFKAFTQHALNRFSYMQLQSVGTRLLRTYLRQPYTFFLQRNSSELSKNMLSEVDQVVIGLVQPAVHAAAQGVIVITMAVLLFVYDPIIAAAVTLSMIGLYGTIYVVFRDKLAHIGAQRVRANTERFQSSSEVLGGIKEVKLTGAADAYLARFDRAARHYAQHLAANDTLAQTPLFLVETVGYCGLIVIAITLIASSGDASHALPALGLYGFAAFRMLPAVQIIYRGVSRMRFSAAALSKLHKDLNLTGDCFGSLDVAPLVPCKRIQLANVSFQYPGMNISVLHDFCLVIPVGSTTALVGRTGSGKSTLMDLLLGLLTPQEGRFVVDDIEISTENVRAWQAAIGYVPQQIYLADASVAENIAFGVPLECIDMVAVRRAASLAQIHDFVVDELKDGYLTFVGERGVRLSGGQRQRIGIARALYRDPPVLFLDEATSALDEATESQVLGAIRELDSCKTIILITHRPAVAASCDVVIDMGA